MSAATALVARSIAQPPRNPSAMRSPCFRRDPIDDASLTIGVQTGAEQDASNLFDRAAGTAVVGADPEYDVLDELKGVIEHEPFHFAVVDASPMRAGEERP